MLLVTRYICVHPATTQPHLASLFAQTEHGAAAIRVGQYDQVGTVSTTLTMLYCKYDTYDRLLFCWSHFQLRRKRIEGRWGLVWMSKIKNAKKRKNAKKKAKSKWKLQMPFRMSPDLGYMEISHIRSSVLYCVTLLALGFSCFAPTDDQMTVDNVSH